MSKRVLLILKKEYFKKILLGEQKNEIRGFNDYYTERFCEVDEDGKIKGLKDFDEIELACGYTSERPTMVVKVENIHLHVKFEENPEDEADPILCEGGYFELELGGIIEKKNCDHIV